MEDVAESGRNPVLIVEKERAGTGRDGRTSRDRILRRELGHEKKYIYIYIFFFLRSRDRVLGV